MPSEFFVTFQIPPNTTEGFHSGFHAHQDRYQRRRDMRLEPLAQGWPAAFRDGSMARIPPAGFVRPGRHEEALLHLGVAGCPGLLSRGDVNTPHPPVETSGKCECVEGARLIFVNLPARFVAWVRLKEVVVQNEPPVGAVIILKQSRRERVKPVINQVATRQDM